MLLDAARAGALLHEAKLDAIVATTRENLIYGADYERTLLYSAGAPGAAILAGDPARLRALVVPRIEAGYLAERDVHPEVLVFYGDFFVSHRPERPLTAREATVVHLLDEASTPAPSFVAGVKEALRRLGLGRATVGWDDVRVGQAQQAEMPGLRVVDAGALWRRIRAVKTAHEIERLRRSAAINEAVEGFLIRLTVPGADWQELMRAWRLLTVQAGAVPGFWSSAPGLESGFIYESMRGTLGAGDIVRYDFGCLFEHYWSDTGRTVVLGAPDTLTRARHHALRAGLEEAVAMVAPGTTMSQLFTTAIDVIHRSGFREYRRHHCGHSLGLHLYDGDYVAATCHTPLEPGMVINIEVPYYELGWGGLQIEDTLLVTAHGSEPLTTAGREIVVN